ncbi:ABC transporter substrate-binding protein [Streptomyces sp. NPDC097640]|uniref:ABC transporter substrate-binding protein n=1 Tax=Streptomyces sp. NPDC097640 TaxID=3157229 RepID=UPI00333225A7
MTSLRPVGRLAVTVAAVTAMATALAGCGGGGQAQSRTGGGKPHRGGTLVVGDESQPLSGLDPILAQALDAKRMAAQFYEGLLSLGPDGTSLRPALATSWKQTTPTTYEFTLRHNVRFHDGRVLSASDVAFSLKRIVDPAVHSPYASLYKFKDVTAPSADKVVVKLAQPQSSLLHLLAQPWSAGIVSEQWARSHSANDLKTRENGTGPYKLSEFREGSLIKTIRFDGYWDRSKPYINEIDYRVMPDEATRVQALQSGTVDTIQVSLPKNAASLKKRGFTVGDRHDVGAYWLGLNTLSGPLANEKVRQAISLGIDRKQLISIGSQGAGVDSGVIPAGDPVLSGDKVDKGDKGDKADLPNAEYDPAEAKRLLDRSGAGTVKLKLAIRSNRPDKLATAQLIKEQLSKIGVTVDIVQIPFEQLIGNLLSGKWNADMIQLTSSLNADASQYLSLWFEKGAKSTKVDDPVLWRRMSDAIQKAGSDQDRARMYKELNRYVAQRVYVLVPYASPTVYDVWSGKVAGFRTEASSTRMFLKDAWIATER